MDRTTLLSTVARLSRKWRRVRAQVFARVPVDTRDSHLRGQAHVFWAARVRACTEHEDVHMAISQFSRATITVMSDAYLRQRRLQARQAAEDGSGNALQRVQSAALSDFLDALTPTPAQETLLAVARYLIVNKVARRERVVQERFWVGGTPNPTLQVVDRRVGDGARRARTQAERLAALAAEAPFPETQCMRFEGRLDLPSGPRPQRFVVPGGPPLEYLRQERPDLLKHLGPSDVSASGAWDTSRFALEVASQRSDGVGHAGDVRRALRYGWSSLRLWRLPQPSIRALECVRVNGRASPGFMSSRLGNNRKEVFAVSVELAKAHYLEAKERFVPDMSFWACGGRDKPSQHLEVGELIKSRLVLMPETAPTILESAFAQPFTRMLGECKGDLMIGCTMTDRGFERITLPMEKHDHVKAYDWSGFDSRVCETLIVGAFSIIRACFHGDDEWLDNVFLRFLSHFLVKRVVTPGGWVYTLAKGVPSGSPFTSVVDSLANWLALVDLEITTGGTSAPRRNTRKVYGDDFLQGFSSRTVGRREYIRLAYTRWGFVAKERAAVEGFMSTTSCVDSLPFLSYRFPCGLPARPVADAIKLGCLPAKRRWTYAQQAHRVMYLDHFAPYDAETRAYHVGYFQWLLTRIPGATFQGDSAPPDITTPWVVKAMANYVADGYSEGIVSLGEWFRSDDPRRWPERWLPRSLAISPPRRVRPGAGKLKAVIAHLRWGS